MNYENREINIFHQQDNLKFKNQDHIKLSL